MSAHLHSIDHTAHVTRKWVRDLARLPDWEDEQRAWSMPRFTLQAPRGWLDINEAAQLPLFIRGLYFKGWQPAKTPTAERSKEAFIARFDQAFITDPIDDPKEAACSVFRLLNNHISDGEVRDARMWLPKQQRELWPR